MEIFDPYVSCRVDTLAFKDVLVNGRQPLDMRAEVFCTVFEDLNGDGNSTGRGEVECMERLD